MSAETPSSDPASVAGIVRPHLTALERELLRQLERQGHADLDLKRDRIFLAKLTRDPDDLLYRLTKKGVAHRLQQGRYWLNLDGRATRFPVSRLWSLDAFAPILLDRLDLPYYVSWHSALWHHRLLDQQSRRLFVAVSKRKRDADVGPFSVRFVTVTAKRLGGYEKEEIGGYQVNMATLEKTLVDAFSEPWLCADPRIVANCLIRAHHYPEFQPARLVTEALALENSRLCRRLGFWMEHLGLSGWEALEEASGGERTAITLMPRYQSYYDDDGSFAVNKRWRVIEDSLFIDVAEHPK